MINIDTDTYLIELTRGDDAVITFGAEDDDGNTYLPTDGDVLTFAVGKRRNKDPLFHVTNTFGEEGTFVEVTPTQTEYEADPTAYFIYSDGEYIRCAEGSSYVARTYYQSTFWDISIDSTDTAELKSATYVWDLQITIDGEITTIIGQTDTLNPQFKVWGEVAQ